ncbi:hypothetical protein JW948_16445 [bacterium]|nr:hypothetical protein [bacterium]
MSRLYSYVLWKDTGAAPNPFLGVCTLAICKPAIRRTAQIGDWIIGTGSKNSSLGDFHNKLIYCMKISSKMSMVEYDSWTKINLKEKTPNWHHSDPRRRCGDSIYDFLTTPPAIRKSVHDENNRDRDLSGKYVLLSTHYWYFGDQAVEIPSDFIKLVKKGSGHRSRFGTDFLGMFIKWLSSNEYKMNCALGRPIDNIFKIEHEILCR